MLLPAERKRFRCMQVSFWRQVDFLLQKNPTLIILKDEENEKTEVRFKVIFEKMLKHLYPEKVISGVQGFGSI